jgi:predicted Rossmann fold nucleotide-binding protein DprA/Smf involved in DNA uptake
VDKNIIHFPADSANLPEENTPGFHYLDSMQVLCMSVQEIADAANITAAEVLTDLMYLVISKEIMETLQ